MKHPWIFAVAGWAVLSVACALPPCEGVLTLGQTSLPISGIDFSAVAPTTRFRPGRQKPGRLIITRQISEASLDDWLNRASIGQLQPLSGDVQVTGDAGEMNRFQLIDVLPTSWTFPACDINNSASAGISLEFSGDITGKKGCNAYRHEVPVGDWTPSNFRLSIEGLDAVTARATRIEPITVSQTYAGNSGIDTETVYQSGDLVFTVPMDTSPIIRDWLDAGGSARAGVLTLLDANGHPIRTISFNVTIKDAVSNEGKRSITCRCATSNLMSEAQSHRIP